MKYIKVTVEVLMEVESWVNSIKDDLYEDNLKSPTKKEILNKLKEDLNDKEILFNNLDEFKITKIKETKQTKFKNK